MDAAKDLILPFFQKVEGGSSGHLIHDFTDPSLNSRFMGDLYQDLSKAARKKYMPFSRRRSSLRSLSSNAR